MATASDVKDISIAELFQRNNRIIVMGVINVTPDSFSDGGQFLKPQRAIDQARRMVEEGADIIDVGGESSRPGSDPVTATEELRRVMPVIESLTSLADTPISIDTWKSEVAETALDAGAIIVNDITALTGDPKMAHVVAKHDAGLVLMHKRGTPASMQTDTRYDNLIGEICDYLKSAIRKAEEAGVDPEKIMVDPGIGFGKDLDGNLEILRSLGRFNDLGKPVLVGASRKSFIGLISGEDVTDRLPGSLSAATAAVINGAAAVRVHDVAATRQAVDIAIKIRGEQ